MIWYIFDLFLKIYYFDLISETVHSKYPYVDDKIKCGNLRKDG